MTSDPLEPNAPELLANNARYASRFSGAPADVSPRRRLAVVACMDSRMDVFALLGLAHGEAHVLRNAGGVVTDDVVRSLCLSQRLLGTREIVLLHHTDCGLQRISEDGFRADLEADLGEAPAWSVEAFTDPADSVRTSMARLRATPFVPHTDLVRGFVYDVTTGAVLEVFDPSGPGSVTTEA